MQPIDDDQINKLQSDLQIFKSVVIAIVIIVSISTVFFHIVEKWNWLDSFYFTIVTIATVGYGNLVPSTDIGKIGNILLIIIGIGIFTVFITQLVKRQGLRQLEKRRKNENNNKK